MFINQLRSGWYTTPNTPSREATCGRAYQVSEYVTWYVLWTACAVALALGSVAYACPAWWWQSGATLTVSAVVVSETVVAFACGGAVPLVWAARAGMCGGGATGLALATSAGFEFAKDEGGVLMQ